jgi:alcohol dehydrogenase (cytochrome c)
VFAGDMEGYVMAFDAASGKLAWKTSTGGAVRAAPMAYAVDNQEFVAVAAGGSLFAFGLPDARGGNEKAVSESSSR